MSAERLREAARVLRERASDATGEGAAWKHINDTGDEWIISEDERAHVATVGTYEDATFIATMHPGVGLALADWLDVTARRIDAGVPAWTANALEVTEAILGGAS